MSRQQPSQPLPESGGGASNGTDKATLPTFPTVALLVNPQASGGVEVKGAPKHKWWLNGVFRATNDLDGLKTAYVKIGHADIWCWLCPHAKCWRFGSAQHRGSQTCWMHSKDKGATPQDCKEWVCGNDRGGFDEAAKVTVKSSRLQSLLSKRKRCPNENGRCEPAPKRGQAGALGGGGAANSFSDAQNSADQAKVSFRDKKRSAELALSNAQERKHAVEADHAARVQAAQEEVPELREARCAVVRRRGVLSWSHLRRRPFASMCIPLTIEPRYLRLRLCEGVPMGVWAGSLARVHGHGHSLTAHGCYDRQNSRRGWTTCSGRRQSFS
jgi:hypothetical protein